MMKNPKVLIGVPTMGSVHTFLLVRLLGYMSDALQKNDIGLSIYPSINVIPVDNARNEIADTFLKGDFTHLFWIDSDTIPPADALKKMLDIDADIVSGMTPIVEYDDLKKDSDSNGFYKKWNCVTEQNAFAMPNTGVIPIHAAGGSCILVKREVYEKMSKPWYRFTYQDDNGKECFAGEDISFVAKALGLGFKAVADTSILCSHSKAILW